MRRTKIVCTLGPATASLEQIRELVRAGMDVARLNFSHGTHESHAELVEWVRQASREQNRQVGILQDLAGPKIRTGKLRKAEPVELRAGQKFFLTSRPVVGSSRRVSVSYEGLARDVKRGDTVLLDDGLIELRVTGGQGDAVETRVVHGGTLRERKGVNLPNVALRVDALTVKDEADLQAGIAMGVDYIALSFVRKAGDVRKLKALLSKAKVHIPVLAKLEKPEAVRNLAAILAVSDGVMVARGDLGVELPPEKVPLVQKKIIQKAAEVRLPVITATQMLESMTVNPRPTRAEASDVANAILDGTDAVMLSGETASGKYPIEAVRMMVRIARQADQIHKESFRHRRSRRFNIAETICEGVVHAAQMLDVKAIVAFTRSGSTARLISKYRSEKPVYAMCHDDSVARRTCLYWGIIPLVLPLTLDSEATIDAAERDLLNRKLVSPGDIIAIVGGIPGREGHTNRMRLIHVGEG